MLPQLLDFGACATVGWTAARLLVAFVRAHRGEHAQPHPDEWALLICTLALTFHLLDALLF